MDAFGSNPYNNPLKPTVTRVTHFAEKAKTTPRYGGLAPPLYAQKLVHPAW
jgi:hypothetical protein